jgi:hypothetical protein
VLYSGAARQARARGVSPGTSHGRAHALAPATFTRRIARAGPPSRHVGGGGAHAWSGLGGSSLAVAPRLQPPLPQAPGNQLPRQATCKRYDNRPCRLRVRVWLRTPWKPPALPPPPLARPANRSRSIDTELSTLFAFPPLRDTLDVCSATHSALRGQQRPAMAASLGSGVAGSRRGYFSGAVGSSSRSAPCPASVRALAYSSRVQLTSWDSSSCSTTGALREAQPVRRSSAGAPGRQWAFRGRGGGCYATVPSNRTVRGGL